MNMKMKSKALLAAAFLAVGMGSGNAAVLINPGGFAFLGTVTGSASVAFAAWDGTDTVALLIESGSSLGAFGYYVDAANSVVAGMVLNAPPVHLGQTSALAVGGTYYLATSSASINPGSPLTNPNYTSEQFTLVPEPGTYAMLAGLGLVAFAGYRRMGS